MAKYYLCPYSGCNLNCRSKRRHRTRYANNKKFDPWKRGERVIKKTKVIIKLNAKVLAKLFKGDKMPT